MDNFIEDYTSLVHDNEIKSYLVVFENESLILNTQWYEKELTSIEFKGLLAHKFDDAIKTNIILGMYQVSLQDFIEEERDYFEESLRHGFPTHQANNSGELLQLLRKSDFKVFYIYSAIGLSGYVIAKEIEIITNEICKVEVD
jgi:hypothetical protein